MAEIDFENRWTQQWILLQEPIFRHGSQFRSGQRVTSDAIKTIAACIKKMNWPRSKPRFGKKHRNIIIDDHHLKGMEGRHDIKQCFANRPPCTGPYRHYRWYRSTSLGDRQSSWVVWPLIRPNTKKNGSSSWIILNRCNMFTRSHQINMCHMSLQLNPDEFH